MVSAEALFVKPDPAGNRRVPGKGGGAGDQGHSPCSSHGASGFSSSSPQLGRWPGTTSGTPGSPASPGGPHESEKTLRQIPQTQMRKLRPGRADRPGVTAGPQAGNQSPDLWLCRPRPHPYGTLHHHEQEDAAPQCVPWAPFSRLFEG